MNVNNGNHDNLFFLTLPPPGKEGDKFDKLATNVHGVPIGETDGKSVLAVTLGYSDKDTIGSSLDDVTALAGQLNIALANPKYASVDYVVVFFKQIDPKNPNLPPINSHVLLSKDMLKEGNIGGIQVLKKQIQENLSNKDLNTEANIEGDVNLEDNSEGTNLGNVPTAGHNTQSNTDHLFAYNEAGINESRELNKRMAIDIEVVKPTGGNLWLSSNAYVAFLTAFADMQRILMQNKVVQGQVELASQGLIWEMAKETKQLILDIAEQNRQIHMTQAIMSGVSIALTALGARYGANMTVLSTTVGQIEKMVTSSVQAARDIPIAQLEGQKEMVQAARTIIQRLMEKQGEAFRADTDKIAQLLQLLDKLRDSLQQAIAASLRK